MDSPCSCVTCPDGAPPSYIVTLAGISNGTCTACNNLNSLTPIELFSMGPGCIWARTFPSICGWTQLTLTFGSTSPGNYAANLQLTGSPGPVIWTGTAQSCFGPFNLTTTFGSGVCNFTGSTATVLAGFPSLPGPEYFACLAAMLKGCPLSSWLGCLLPAPPLGAAPQCCGQCKGGCPGGPGCECGRIIPAQVMTALVAKCTCRSIYVCPGGTAIGTPPPVMQCAKMLDRWNNDLAPKIPGAQVGLAKLNVSNGNLVVQLQTPEAGPFDPTPVLTYNSTSPTASEFGTGFSAFPKQTLATTTNGVDVTDATGTVLHYTDKDSSGRYRVPGSTNDTMVKNADGTWTQTQPDGFQVRYDSTGKIKYGSSE